MPTKSSSASSSGVAAIHRMHETADAPLDATIDGGNGTDGDDVIINASDSEGRGGADTITGTTGIDFIAGYSFEGGPDSVADGGDVINGLGGDDVITGDGGADAIEGGDGIDDLYGGGLNSNPLVGDLGDRLSGGAGDDSLYGNYGADVLRGGTGADILSGQWGDDVVDGGAGYDNAVFNLMYEAHGVKFKAVKFVPNQAMLMDDGQGGRDRLAGIERLTVYGTNYADTLVGSAWRDVLIDTGGDNLLDGGAGNDQLIDWGGSSTLFGGTGDDRLTISAYGDQGSRLLEGGDGIDTVIMQYGSVASGLQVRLTAKGEYASASADGAYIAAGHGIEALNVNAGSGADRLAGAGLGDSLAGGGGDDTVFGGKGDDTLSSGGGDDRIDGGSGRDIFVIPVDTQSVDAVVVDASLFDVSGDSAVYDDAFGHVMLFGIDGYGVTGSYGDDLLIGSAGGDRIESRVGQDTVAGGRGDDIIVQGTLDGISADIEDQIDGGAGFDTVTFIAFSSNLLIDLTSGQMGSDRGDGQPIAMTGTLANVEGVLAGDGADRVIGGGSDERLTGAFGDDTVSGGAGADTLTGGLGRDWLSGGGGKDRFVYVLVDDSTRFASDLIDDYQSIDRIDLRAIDANIRSAGDQAFARVAAFTGHGGELVVTFEHGLTSVLGDLDGDGMADLQIDLTGNHAADIVFVL